MLGYSKGVIFITVAEKELNSYTEALSDTSVTSVMILKFNSKPSIFTSWVWLVWVSFVFTFNKTFVLGNVKHTFTENCK